MFLINSVNPLILCQISSVKGYEEEAKVAYATLLDIEGKTEEAIATLETVNTMSSVWHLAQVFSVCFFSPPHGLSFTNV